MRIPIPTLLNENPRVALVALGFLFYCLCTDSDSIANDLAATAATAASPAPYDVFSLGMLAVLGAGASLQRACAALYDERLLAAGTALMAAGPLYAMLAGPSQVIYLLALLGGLGKAVVLLQLIQALSLIGPHRSLLTVALMGAASTLLNPLFSTHSALYSLVSLIAAPSCGVCLLLCKAKGGLLSKKEGSEPSSMRPWEALPVSPGKFRATILLLGCATVLCSEPLLSHLGSIHMTALQGSLVALCGAAVALIFLLLVAGRSKSPYRRGVQALVGLVLLPSCGFLAFDGVGARFWYAASYAGQFLFQTLFFSVAPFIGNQRAGAREDPAADGAHFARSALCYCLALSGSIFLYRSLGNFTEEGPLLFAGILCLVGGTFCASEAISKPIKSYDAYIEIWQRGAAALSQKYHLSTRESEVFLLASRGYDARAIQDELVISPSTVSTHLQNIYRKLEVHSKQDLITLVEDQLATGDDAPGATGSPHRS